MRTVFLAVVISVLQLCVLQAGEVNHPQIPSTNASFLTPEQAKQIDEFKALKQPERDRLYTQLQEKQKQNMDINRKDNVDPQEAKKLRDEIREIRKKIRDIDMAIRDKEETLLTPQQKEERNKLIEEGRKQKRKNHFTPQLFILTQEQQDSLKSYCEEKSELVSVLEDKLRESRKNNRTVGAPAENEEQNQNIHKQIAEIRKEVRNKIESMMTSEQKAQRERAREEALKSMNAKKSGSNNKGERRKMPNKQDAPKN